MSFILRLSLKGLWLQIRYMTTIFPRMNFLGMCWEDGVIQAAFL
ncbi:hypothetical protein Hanom_Chr12g01111721 [Helianthus anomalus]